MLLTTAANTTPEFSANLNAITASVGKLKLISVLFRWVKAQGREFYSGDFITKYLWLWFAFGPLFSSFF